MNAFYFRSRINELFIGHQLLINRRIKRDELIELSDRIRRHTTFTQLINRNIIMTTQLHFLSLIITVSCVFHASGSNVTLSNATLTSSIVTQPETTSSNITRPETTSFNTTLPEVTSLNATRPETTNATEDDFLFLNSTLESFDIFFNDSEKMTGSTAPSIYENNVTVEFTTATTSVPISMASTTTERTSTPEISSKSDTKGLLPTEAHPSRHKTWFVLTLEGNCSVISRGRQGQGEKSLKNQLYQRMAHFLSTEDLTVTEIRCIPAVDHQEDRIQVNFTVCLHPDPISGLEGAVANLSERLDQLEASTSPLLRIHDTDLFVLQIHLWDGAYLNKEPEVTLDLRHTDVELVVYIAVGSSCAFLVTLAAILLLCKYCCSNSSSSSPDSSHPKAFDIPRSSAHMENTNYNNLRLEDYTLTRIPRPKFGYVDYYRGVAKRYSPLDEKMVTSSSAGMVRPFDTSVVPLEDAASAYSAPSARYFKDGVIVRPNDVTRFDTTPIYNEGFARSNEYLHAREAGLGPERGIDNPNFR